MSEYDDVSTRDGIYYHVAKYRLRARVEERMDEDKKKNESNLNEYKNRDFGKS